MILNRYINRQLLVTTIVVTFVLMMVLVSGQFIKYLAEAAVGEISADILLLVMLFRMPEFLQMILPLSMFIGMLLVFGRLSIDNELVVMRAGGIGMAGNARGLFWPVLMATALIGLFSLYITPRGDAEVTRLFEEQKNRSVLELITPGRFFSKSYGDLQRSTYAEQVDRKSGLLGNLFISEIRYGERDAPRQSLTIRAKSGKLVHKDGLSYLQLDDGIEYQGVPGQGSFRQVSFERALLQVGEERAASRPPKVRGWTTPQLLKNADQGQAMAELQWRIALVLIVPIMCIAAVPLGQVNPRQGRFGKMVPAILLYMVYIGMLLVTRSRIADIAPAERPWYLNMAWIHLVMVMLVLFMYSGPRLLVRLRERFRGGQS